MKLQLIMLDNPIIVSDGTPNKFYEGFYFLDGKVFHTSKIMLQTGCKEVIAQSHQIDWNGLEDKFGYVDVEKLVSDLIPNEGTMLHKQRCLDVVLGFKKAQELNDKKFSLEDIRKAMDYASQITNNRLKYIQDYIDLLSQPKVFNVEVEMENLNLFSSNSEMYDVVDNKLVVKLSPKFTEAKIKIIKKL